MRELLRTRSLRSWVALGMLVALAPFAVSTVLGYFLLQRGVIAPIHDVALRQAEQMVPAQRLQLLLQDAVIAVDEYVEDADPRHLEAYRQLRGRIEAGFVELVEAVEGDPAVQTLARRAHENWTSASNDATQLLAVTSRHGDPAAIEAMQRFHGDIVATSDELGVVAAQLAERIEEDHDAAVLNYERSLWMAGIAAFLSLMAVAGGVSLIGRIIGGSVDRLVEGAARFAEGDRAHRIMIQVPPELHRVAEEFNRMIGRVHESEEALANLSRLDSLTGLSNRRSFDAALGDAASRLQKFGEPYSLLVLDIDHFKRINDTMGHTAGDDVLRVLARIMNENVRSSDRVFRVGGEEFAVIMPHTGLADAQLVAERIRKAAGAKPVSLAGGEVSLTISAGVVAASERLEPKAVLDLADAALYRAKASGRNRVVAEVQQADVAS